MIKVQELNQKYAQSAQYKSFFTPRQGFAYALGQHTTNHGLRKTTVLPKQDGEPSQTSMLASK